MQRGWPAPGARIADAQRNCAATSERCSMATKRAISVATPTSDSSVRAEPHPCSGASTTVNTRSRMPAVMLAAPGGRGPDDPGPRGHRRGSGATPPARVAAAMTTGTRKTSRQLISVSTPPRTRPKAKPAPPVAVDRAVAQRAFGEARRDDRQSRRCGERGGDALEEARRDQHRAIVRDASDAGGDEATASDEEHLAAAEQVGGSPPSSRKPPKPTSLPLTSHCSERVDMPRSAWIEEGRHPASRRRVRPRVIEAHSTRPFERPASQSTGRFCGSGLRSGRGSSHGSDFVEPRGSGCDSKPASAGRARRPERLPPGGAWP